MNGSFENTPLGSALSDALRDSFGGNREAVKHFYTLLLDSSVYVPCRGSVASGFVGIRENPQDAFPYVKFSLDGREYLPAFSRGEFAVSWLGDQDAKVATVPFRELIWHLGSSMWIYLDSGCVVGKEFSPWEIDRLREWASLDDSSTGDGAPDKHASEELLNELFSELEFDAPPGVQVLDDASGHESIRRQLRASMEIFDFVKEAFLLELTNTNDDRFFVLGLVTDSFPTGDGERLEQEIAEAFERVGVVYRFEYEVVSNLWHSTSPYRSLFHDRTPFYIRTEMLRQGDAES